MLQQIRKAQGWMIKGVLWAVVLAFVVTIFYSWGVRSSSGPTRSEAATILGEPISIRDFQRVQNALYQTYRNFFRNQPEIDLHERFNFREMALEQIARRHLLQRMARAQGITVTDAELFDRIAAMPTFQDQGRFSAARYQTVLQSQVPPIPPQQFEVEQRRDLEVEKVYTFIRAGVQVTATEVEQAYRSENEQVAVRYVTLLPSLFTAQVQVSDEELVSYYEAHKEAYREPEQRQIRYVAISPQRFQSTAALPDQDIAQYYANHQEMFQREEQVHARHILFKVAEEATPEQEAEVRARAEQVQRDLRAGGDFATLAQQYSDDTATAEKGGDLGFFPRGQMVQPFEEVAFSLEVGETSDLVRTEFGYHLIQVEDKIADEVKPLVEVQQEIRTKIHQQKARDATLVFVDDLMITLEDTPEQFTAAAQQHELPVVTTPFLPITGRIATADSPPELVQRAFTLAEQAVGTVEGTDGTHYIFQVAAIQPSTVAELATIKERVSSDLQRQKSTEMASQTADEWARQAQAGTPLQELAASLQVKVIETGLFKRRDPVPDLGRSPAFSERAFDLQDGAIGVAHEGSRHFVLQVVSRQAADMGAYEAEKATYRKQLLSRKQQQVLGAFQAFLQTQYQQLRQRGEIVVNPQYVF
jgi:peptidyl-prolyl cis-trans isomerase D